MKITAVRWKEEKDDPEVVHELEHHDSYPDPEGFVQFVVPIVKDVEWFEVRIPLKYLRPEALK